MRSRSRRLDEDKRRSLIDAAIEEIAVNGMDGASYNRIIERSGLSKGAVYYYFENKESLYKTPKTAWLDPNPPQVYVGLEHYEKLVNDAVFKQILTNSLYWTIGVVFFQNLIGLATAVLLDQKLPMRGAMRALVLLPWLLGGCSTARTVDYPQADLVRAVAEVPDIERLDAVSYTHLTLPTIYSV